MQKQVISFHYSLSDASGNKIDSSLGGAPMLFLEGSGQIIPGLEQALAGMQKGDKQEIRFARLIIEAAVKVFCPVPGKKSK